MVPLYICRDARWLIDFLMCDRVLIFKLTNLVILALCSVKLREGLRVIPKYLYVLVDLR